MASKIDIANLALTHLGESNTIVSIEPPSGSPYARYAATFYPMARDFLLSIYPWNFNTRRISPATLDSEASSYAYAYAVPNEALTILSVLPPNTTDDYVGGLTTALQSVVFISDLETIATGALPQNFAREVLADGQHVIYTNVEDAVIRYTMKIENPAKFSAPFVMALSRLLASYLAGPVIKGKRGVDVGKAQFQIFIGVMGMAQTHDANQSKNTLQWKPPWMRNRG